MAQAPRSPCGVDPEAGPHPLPGAKVEKRGLERGGTRAGRGHRLGGRRGRGRGGEALLVKNKLLKDPVKLAAWSLVSEPDNKLLKIHEVQTPHNNTL